MADEGYEAMTRFFRGVRSYLAAEGRMVIFFGTSGDLGYLRGLMDEECFSFEAVAHDQAQMADAPVEPADCLECGFEVSAVSAGNAEQTIRSLGPRYQAALRSGSSNDPSDARLRARPEPDTWSALEYAAHMRDVVALWGWALHRTLSDDTPELPAADPGLPNRVAAEADYNRQDPATVERELSANAERMARKVGTVSAEQWLRTARFGEVEINPLWIVRKVAHEGHHHLLDIEKSLGADRSD